MRTIKVLLPVLMILFVVASCSKEKRIERHLHKGDGKWNITEERSESYVNGTLDEVEVYPNAGSMTFDKKGSIIYTQTYEPGQEDSYGGTWTNTKDEITLIVDSEVLIFKIKEESRKEMVLEYNESYTNFEGDTEKYVMTLKMKKA